MLDALRFPLNKKKRIPTPSVRLNPVRSLTAPFGASGPRAIETTAAWPRGVCFDSLDGIPEVERSDSSTNLLLGCASRSLNDKIGYEEILVVLRFGVRHPVSKTLLRNSFLHPSVLNEHQTEAGCCSVPQPMKHSRTCPPRKGSKGRKEEKDRSKGLQRKRTLTKLKQVVD